MNIHRYTTVLCCLLASAVLLVPARGLSSGASYGDLSRRSRVVTHDGKTFVTNPVSPAASTGFLQPYHRDLSEQMAAETGGGSLFPMTSSALAATQLTVWKPVTTLGNFTPTLPASPTVRPYLPHNPRIVVVDPFGAPPVKLAKLPTAVKSPSAVQRSTQKRSSTPYLVRPARPNQSVITTVKPRRRPARPIYGSGASRPAGGRIPVRR
ncbi:MAG: hypothetical protein LKE33_03285 [Acidaminococcus sp.]|jgi:hypothetical protein|nr:hypothetical protein [Acidaminococcus sp.]MCI2115333.1 hypothetical protein [Acidaminococcus sp.]MCI2117406.1 hypothetical protein [Acidaminococcus sp.]